MIIIVYFCDGIVLHVVQIGCAKIWCQSYLYGPAVQMYVEMSWVGGRLEVGQNVRRRFVRYVTSDVCCCLHSFAGVLFGVIAFVIHNFVLRSGDSRSYVL